MKENPQTGNEITNQWLKFWAESSTLAWKNWLVLMGLISTNDASDTEQSSKDFKPNHLSEPENEVFEHELGFNSTEPLKEIQFLKQQLSLKDSQIAALNNRITTSETEITEKSKYYSFLEQEHRQQSQTIEKLKVKINQLENKLLENQAEKEHNQQELESSKFITQVEHFQEELSVKEHQLNDLKNLAEKTKDYYSIQKEHRQQSQTIEELKAKIAQLKNQPLTEPNNLEGDSSVVLAQIKSLHQELSTKEYLIAQLKAQIATSEGKIEEKAKNYLLLEQESRQKTEIIEQLQAKISNLETVAIIGERQLNKWRSRTFFS